MPRGLYREPPAWLSFLEGDPGPGEGLGGRLCSESCPRTSYQQGQRGKDSGDGESIQEKSDPSLFCIKSSYGLSADTGPGRGKERESLPSLESGPGQLQEVFSGRSPWALPVHPHQLLGTWGHTDREAGHKGESSLDNIPAPAGRRPSGKGSKSRLGHAQPWIPLLLTQESRTATCILQARPQ